MMWKIVLFRSQFDFQKSVVIHNEELVFFLDLNFQIT